MRKFLISVGLFLASIVFFLIGLEFLVHRIPNSYSYKYNYITQDGDNLEAIAMGHSQLYDGFEPESFKLKAFNLCNSAQSFKEDYYLLQELLPKMPKLKCVILPFGYVNVKEKANSEGNNTWSERSTFYHEYMHIDYGNVLPLKYRFECLNPGRAFEKVTSYYLHHIDIVGCDSLGRRSTHNFKDRKHELGHDKVLYDYTITTHNPDSMMIECDAYLEKIASLLNSKHIKLVLVAPPYFWYCFDNANEEQKAFVQNYIKRLKSKFKFQYIDLENDKRFEDKDFYNETHLSELGAEKFTIILNDSISIGI